MSSANITCPSCDAVLTLSDPPVPGKAVQCPECGTTFRTRAVEGGGSTKEAEVIQALPPTRRAPFEGMAERRQPGPESKPPPDGGDLPRGDATRTPFRAGRAREKGSRIMIWFLAGVAALLLVGIVVAALVLAGVFWQDNRPATPVLAGLPAAETPPPPAVENPPPPAAFPPSEVITQAWATRTSNDKYVSCLAITPDGRTLASGSWDGTVRLWDLASANEQAVLRGHLGMVHVVAFSPDGKTLASAGYDKRVQLWDVATKAPGTEFKGLTNDIHALAFSPDGKLVAASSAGPVIRGQVTWMVPEIKLWDVATGAEVATLKEEEGGRFGSVIAGMAFTPDGRTLVVAGVAGDVTLWDHLTRRVRLSLAAHIEKLTAFAMTRDGQTVATASKDGTVKLWEVASGRQRATLGGHPTGVASVAFSSDGKTLAAGTGNDLTMGNTPGPEEVRLWDIAEKRVTTILQGHNNYVAGVVLSPDGKIVVSGSWDKTVRWWDLTRQRPTPPAGPATLPGSPGPPQPGDLLIGRWQGLGWETESLEFGKDGTVVALLKQFGELRGRYLILADRYIHITLQMHGGSTLVHQYRFRVTGEELVTTDEKDQTVGHYRRLVDHAPPTPKRRNFPEEILAQEKTLRDLEQAGKGEGAEALNLVRRLAATQRLAGHYEEAMALLDRAFQASEPGLKPGSMEVPPDLDDLAETALLRGDFPGAERLLLDTLASRKERLGPNHPAVAAVLFALGAACEEVHDFPPAAGYFDQCLHIREAVLDSHHPDLAQSWTRCGQLSQYLGEFQKAEPALKRALEICGTAFGRAHPRVAEAEADLALLYQVLGKGPESEDYWNRSLNTLAACPDLDSPPALHALRLQADRFRALRQFSKAAARYQQCLDSAEGLFPPEHTEVVLTRTNLGLVYTQSDRSEQAVPYFAQAAAALEKRFGPEHPALFQPLHDLAVAYQSLNRLEDAEGMYRRALRAVTATPGPPSPEAIDTVFQLAGLLVNQGRWGEACDLFDKGVRDLRGMTTRVLPILSDTDQLRFLREHSRAPLYQALTAAAYHNQDREFVCRSCEWAINSKGVAVEALAERALTARDAADPEVKPLAAELTAVRDELSALPFGGARPYPWSPTGQRLHRLWEREQELTVRLGEAARRHVATGAWVTLDQVRQQLGEGTVLVEIMKFQTYDFQSQMFGGLRYLAWVIPKAGAGDVQMIVLGDAVRIERTIGRFHGEISAGPALIQLGGEKAAEQELHDIIDQLTASVFAPLELETGGAGRWLVCPDGALWLVPFGVLFSNSGAYAAESLEFTYLVTSRDLVKAHPGTRPNPPLVVANPDYDLGVPTDARGTGPFQPLPGTEAEAKAVTPALARYTGKPPVVLTGDRALERAVKSAISPQILILSTHGYFDADEDPAGGLTEHPLLRCGLALAGANNTKPGGRGGSDNGVLTGLEVLGIDLRGTEMAVLSACETGLGQVSAGEGVAGLRQSFHLAGATSVMATLWSIPDRETAELMSRLFDGLAAGRRPPQALREAQAAMIKARRAKGGQPTPCSGGPSFSAASDTDWDEVGRGTLISARQPTMASAIN